MTLFGIDASTTSTGLSVFVDNNLVQYYRICGNDKNVYNRIKNISDSLSEYFKLYSPQYVFIEDVPLSNAINRRVAEKLLLLQGCILCLSQRYDCKFVQIPPLKWRKIAGVVCKNKREEQKRCAIELVSRKYDLDFIWTCKEDDDKNGYSDICESILIGSAGISIVEGDC